jgi:hypothetical protein
MDCARWNTAVQIAACTSMKEQFAPPYEPESRVCQGENEATAEHLLSCTIDPYTCWCE